MAGRTYAAGKYALELNGKLTGWLHKASGGGASADVVTEKLGPDHVVRKHIAGAKYEEIVLEAGLGMSDDFYQWISDSWSGKYSRKDGALVTTDFDGVEHSRKSFSHALITEVAMPALDASSKDAARIVVKIQPELTRNVKGSGSKLGSTGAKAEKKWLPSNFRLDIPGLDCKYVNKIAELVVTKKGVENPVGELRDYEMEPSHAEFGNLTVTLAESHADTWYKWFEDFVVKGNCDQDKEKSGSLVYLTPDLKAELFHLELSNIGIFKLAEEHQESGSEGMRRVKAELYVEKMRLEMKGVVKG